MKKLLMFLGILPHSTAGATIAQSCFKEKKLSINQFFLDSKFIDENLLVISQRFESIYSAQLYTNIANEIIKQYKNENFKDIETLKLSDFDFAKASKEAKPWLIQIYNGESEDKNLINYDASNLEQEYFLENGFKNNDNSLNVVITTKNKHVNTVHGKINSKIYFEQFFATSNTLKRNNKIAYDSNGVPTIDTLTKKNAVDVSDITSSEFNTLNPKNSINIKNLLGTEDRTTQKDSFLRINKDVLNHFLNSYNTYMQKIINLNLIKEPKIEITENDPDGSKIYKYTSYDCYSIYVKNNTVSELNDDDRAQSGDQVYARFFPSQWYLLDESKIMIPENDSTSFYLYLGTIS